MKTNYAIISVRKESVKIETETGIKFDTREHFNSWMFYFKAIGLEQLSFHCENNEGHYVLGKH